MGEGCDGWTGFSVSSVSQADTNLSIAVLMIACSDCWVARAMFLALSLRSSG
jgi:hypothetical protein